MNIDKCFPSNYLKASDLQGRNVPVTIEKVVMEDIGSDHKPVVYFTGKEKGLVLNKTNSNNISVVYGPETENWVNQQIILYPTIVDFQGRSVDAIRVMGPRHDAGQEQRAQTDSAPVPPPPSQSAIGSHPLDDDIPF